MNQSRQNIFKALIAFALIVSSHVLLPTIAKAQEMNDTVDIGTVRDPNGNARRMRVRLAPRRQVLGELPSIERMNWLMHVPQAVNACNAHIPYPIHFAQTYSIQKLAMSVAFGISAIQQATNLQDPMAIEHWVHHSFTDPTAYASFAAFQLASDSLSQIMRLSGMVFDECEELRRFQRNEPFIPDERFSQRIWGRLMGPLSMGIGSYFSTVASDLLNDQNVRLCARSMITELRGQELQQAQHACDQATIDWAASNQIRRYTPDLLGGVLTATIQATPGILAVTMPALMSARVIPMSPLARSRMIGAAAAWALEPASVLSSVGADVMTIERVTATIRMGVGMLRFFPGGISVGLMLGQLAIDTALFFGISGAIQGPINRHYHSFMDRNDIAAQLGGAIRNSVERARNMNWAWQAPATQTRCIHRTYSARDMELNNHPDTSHFAPDECATDTPQPSPQQAIAALHDKFAQWRGHALEETTAAVGNWRDFLGQISTIMANSIALYGDVAQKVYDYHRTRVPNEYYAMQAYYGIPFHPAPNACALDAPSLAILRSAIAEARRTAGRQTPGIFAEDAEYMRTQVLPGLEDFDCANTLSLMTRLPILMVELTQQHHVDMAHRTPEQVLEIARYYELGKSMRALHRKVAQQLEGVFGGMQYPAGSTGMLFAGQRNPFVRLHIFLGEPDLLPMGEEAIMQKNLIDAQNHGLFSLATINLHPASVGRVATPTMAEYLLASMVCGPSGNEHNCNAQGQCGQSWFPHWYIERFGDRHMTELDRLGARFGTHAMFYPPRMTNDLGFNFCRHSPDGMVDLGSIPTPQLAPNRVGPIGLRVNPAMSGLQGGFSMHDKTWTVGNTRYFGLLDVVRRNLPQEILAGDPDPQHRTRSGFAVWWARVAKPDIDNLLTGYKREYMRVIQEKFLPALNSTAEWQLPVFPMAVAAAATGQSPLTVPGFGDPNSFRLKLGVKASILQEVALNMGFLETAFRAGRQVTPAQMASFNAAKAAFNGRLALGLMFLGTNNELNSAMSLVEIEASVVNRSQLHFTRVDGPHQRAAGERYTVYQTQAQAALTALAAKVGENHLANPTAQATINGMKTAAIGNLHAILGDVDVLWGDMTIVGQVAN